MPENTKDGVTTVETTFRILELVKNADAPGLGAISEELDIARSTAHRHLVTLQKHRFVVKSDGGYRVGLRFLDYGRQSQLENQLFEQVKPKVDHIAEETNEKAFCCVEQHGIGIFLYIRDGENSVQTHSYIGEQIHLHQHASGKAILAHLPEQKISRIVETYGLPERTNHTVTEPDELLNELRTVRESGVAYNYQESVENLRAVGVPIRNLNTNGVYGAISVSGPASRLTGDYFETELPDLLRGISNELELNLAYE